jgi:hypothetical protein
VFAFVAVGVFASPPSAGMYKCTDESYRVAYVKIGYFDERSTTITTYDLNKNRLTSYRVSVNSSNPDILQYDGTNFNRYYSSAGENSIKNSYDNKTYVRVHDFTYDQ